MKDILVLVHHDAGQDARLRAAVDLAQRLGGHLTCLDVTKLPATFGTEFAAGAILLEQESRREHRNRDVVQSWLKRQGVPWTWLDCTGSLASSVIDAAGLADLIVLNRRLDDAIWPDMRDVTANVLMHLHNPIVAMPEDAEGFAFERALVAWDGKPAAAAAVRSAVPLLQLASEVEVFMVGDGADGIASDALLAYLQRHEITASIRVVDRGSRDVAELILDESARFRADYIVMGGYTHGRAAELFGGVTRSLLSNSSVPLVISR